MSETETNWKDSLPEDIKESVEISTFKNVEDLAKSHIHLTKAYSKSVNGVDKEDSFDTYTEKQGVFNKIPKDKKEYKPTDNDILNDLGHKYKLHGEFQLKPLAEELAKLNENKQKVTDLENKEKWSKASDEIYSKETNKDLTIGRALAALGTTKENLATELGNVSNHPVFSKMLLALGKNYETPESSPELTSGGDPQESTASKDAYVRAQVDNMDSPYHNSKHPNHTEVRMKVKTYISEIMKSKK